MKAFSSYVTIVSIRAWIDWWNALEILFCATREYITLFFSHSGLVHTTLDKFENAALFLLLGLPSTRILHENGAFRKRYRHTGQDNTVSQTLAPLYFRRSVDGKHLMCFSSEIFVFKFIRRSLNVLVHCDHTKPFQNSHCL